MKIGTVITNNQLLKQLLNLRNFYYIRVLYFISPMPKKKHLQFIKQCDITSVMNEKYFYVMAKVYTISVCHAQVWRKKRVQLKNQKWEIDEKIRFNSSNKLWCLEGGCFVRRVACKCSFILFYFFFFPSSITTVFIFNENVFKMKNCPINGNNKLGRNNLTFEIFL